jgi:ribonuclease HII
MLKRFHTKGLIEAGCDEAGRGCLAGPVYAAAVILPADFKCKELNDSKVLTDKQRYKLRPYIEENAIAYAVSSVDQTEIDRINILNASFKAMHQAIEALAIRPQHLIIDGNRFKAYELIPHHCIIKGDGKFMSIAAASVLAKTYRDDLMDKIHSEFPEYDWIKNKGYPTLHHRKIIMEKGITPYHRKTYTINETQLSLF